MFITYIIQSESTGKYYCGQTSNLNDRLLRHNSGRSKSTKGKGSWILIKHFQFRSRSEAVLMENKIKSRGIQRFLKEF